LVYGRSAITPLDLLLEQSEAPTDEDLENNILDRIYQVIDTLELARQNVAMSQCAQEETNPAATTTQTFTESELVLKFKHTKPKGSKFQVR
jgi:hypothetical protein